MLIIVSESHRLAKSMGNTDKSGKKIKEGFVGQKMIVLPPNIKRSISKNELLKRFYVTAIGFYPHAAFHDRERKLGCNQHILLYCTAGTGTVTVKGDTFRLRPNHYLILPKNTPHRYSSSQDEPWTIYWVHFMGDDAGHLYSRYRELGAEPAFIAYEEERSLKFDFIFRVLEESFAVRSLEIANITAKEFISNFIYAPEINPAGIESDKISASIAYMKNNLSQQLAVEQLAQQQNLSVTHYSRLFRVKTGSSPNQYFTELKVQKSCQYLYFTDRSIKEICGELGFSDPYYFSRLFKKLMGVSPAKYKAQRRKE